MIKRIIIYFFLLFQVIYAQTNDISTSRFLWTDYDNNEGIAVLTSDYTSEFLIRWNDDKIVNNNPINMWSFDTDNYMPSNLVGQEDEIDLLFSNAVSSWYDNYQLKLTINDSAEEGVLTGFAENETIFQMDGGGYASGRVLKPVKWNGTKAQFETFELLEENESLTNNWGLDVFFFSNHIEAPTWTTSTTPDNNDMLGTVILHELGHVLLMGHSSPTLGIPPRIMDNAYDPSVIVPTLTAGDISNATFHYNSLYSNSSIEGDVTFLPEPGFYKGTQTIEMTNNSSYTGMEIWFNYYLASEVETAEMMCPDLSTSDMQYYYPQSYNNKNVYPGWWYYFKAKLYDPVNNVFVGQQTEGAYFAETNPCSPFSEKNSLLTRNRSQINLKIKDKENNKNEK